LQQYLKEYKSCYGLFEGQEYGQYSLHSVQANLRQALDQSGVNPLASLHTLPYSFTTLLLENATDLRYIQLCWLIPPAKQSGNKPILPAKFKKDSYSPRL